MVTSPQPLRFPRGVRLAREGDLPSNGRTETLARIQSAQITTGFVPISITDTGYFAYLEANVHADEVWSVFATLATRLLPDVVSPLIGWKDAEPTIGAYTDWSAALAVFHPHREGLQHDGWIQFGLLFQSEGRTEEV